MQNWVGISHSDNRLSGKVLKDFGEMGKFEHKFSVSVSKEEVAAFHSSSRALKKLTLPFILLQFHKLEPLAEDSVTEFTMWFGPIPVKWKARHVEVTEHGFVDIQESGPFRLWMHRHSFIASGDFSTKVIDQIEYEFSRSPFWNIIGHIMVWNLPLNFAFRAWATRKSLAQGKI